jgi:hypothetical protein
MAWSYEIDEHRRLVRSVTFGLLSARDVVAFRQHLAMDPAFDPAFCMLVDFSKVTKVDLFPDEVRILAAISPFLPTARRAFVVPDNPQNLELLKVLALFDATLRFSAKGAVRLFTNQKDALEWLFEKGKPTNGSARGASQRIRHPAVRNGSRRKHALSRRRS